MINSQKRDICHAQVLSILRALSSENLPMSVMSYGVYEHKYSYMLRPTCSNVDLYEIAYCMAINNV